MERIPKTEARPKTAPKLLEGGTQSRYRYKVKGKSKLMAFSIDASSARRGVKQRAQARAERCKSCPVFTWRDVPRVGIPLYLISYPFNRGIRGISLLLDRILQDVYSRLERLDDKHIDTDVLTLSRLERRQLAIARWLMQEPNSAHQAIPAQTQASPVFSSTCDPSQASERELSVHEEKDHE